MAGEILEELLQCSEKDFERIIQNQDVMHLLDTVSILQNEMTKEQGEIDSLMPQLKMETDEGAESYKRLEKKIEVSKNRFTILMNRSMKCFSQQAMQHLQPDGQCHDISDELVHTKQTSLMNTDSAATTTLDTKSSSHLKINKQQTWSKVTNAIDGWPGLEEESVQISYQIQNQNGFQDGNSLVDDTNKTDFQKSKIQTIQCAFHSVEEVSVLLTSDQKQKGEIKEEIFTADETIGLNEHMENEESLEKTAGNDSLAKVTPAAGEMPSENEKRTIDLDDSAEVTTDRMARLKKLERLKEKHLLEYKSMQKSRAKGDYTCLDDYGKRLDNDYEEFKTIKLEIEHAAINDAVENDYRPISPLPSFALADDYNNGYEYGVFEGAPSMYLQPHLDSSERMALVSNRLESLRLQSARVGEQGMNGYLMEENGEASLEVVSEIDGENVEPSAENTTTNTEKENRVPPSMSVTEDSSVPSITVTEDSSVPSITVTEDSSVPNITVTEDNQDNESTDPAKGSSEN